MSYTYITPPESLINLLTKIYVKNIEQENLFNDIFNNIENVIDTAKKDIENSEKTNIYCSNYKDTFINKLNDNNIKLKELFDDTNIKSAIHILIIHLLKIADTFTYGILTAPSTCILVYHKALVDQLEQIKQTILEKRIDNLYEYVANNPKIKELIEIKEINKDIDALTNNDIQDKIDIQKLQDTLINISDSNLDQITNDYVLNKLKTKYEEFLAISPQLFSPEIKNKIKKSVIEIIAIELNLQKKLNIKTSLPFTNVIKEFLNQ